MSTQGHESEAINVSGLKASLKKGGNIGIYNEAICSTAGGTAAKVTNTTPPSFTLTAGAKILVKFTYAISAENATLQVGSNTAKPIYYKGSALPADLVKAGTSLLLSYDGTSYNIVGDLNTDTTYSTMGASGSTHASGLVPDTPSVAGTTKFLREDGTWQEVSASPEVQIGGNTPSSESDIKLFVDESDDDTVEVYTKAQADGQFIVIVNSNSAPTSSTLIYTATDGTTKNFKVGDEVRVPDAEADNGYTFYKLYALTTESNVTTATWDKLGAGEGGSAAGLEIVAASGTTLNAEVGKYYRYDSDVTTLAVTLPTITGATEVQEFKMYFHTPALSNPSITFTGGTITKFGNFSIVTSSYYCVDCIWNGGVWTIQANESKQYDAEIEYLQSSGTQYIDTDFKVSSSFEIDITFGTPITQPSNYGRLIGAGNDASGAYQYGSIATNSTNTNILQYSNGDNDIFKVVTLNSGISIHNTRMVYSSGTTTIYYNGEVKDSITNNVDFTKASYGNLYIFAYNNCNFNGAEKSSTATRYAGFKLYRCKILLNNLLIRDFIPVRIGQVGYLFDNVSKTLFANQGTGSFTLGPDI